MACCHDVFFLNGIFDKTFCIRFVADITRLQKNISNKYFISLKYFLISLNSKKEQSVFLK